MSDTQKARKLLPGPYVDRRYEITGRTRNRWKNDPKLNFPKPAAVINGREYYNEADLNAWDRETAAKGRAASKSEVA
jgi:hypothetical protein